FNARERAHMVDVRTLYQNAMAVRWIALGVWVAIVAALILLRKKAFLDDLSRGFLFVSFLFVLFLILLGIWILADFTGFWTTFHACYLPCLSVAVNKRRQSTRMLFFPQSVGRRQRR